MKPPTHIGKPVAFERRKSVAHAIHRRIDPRHGQCAFSNVQSDAVKFFKLMQQ
ncbi:hypothetical protein D3C81_2117840 [compost metagenome]